MPITCVVAAVDGSPESLHAVDWAADEAVRRGVRLLLVNACLWERYELPDADEGDPSSVRAAVEDLTAAALRRAATRHPGIEVDAETIPEDTVTALLGLRRLTPLLVMGSRGRGGFAGLLLGSVSLRVAGRAAFPVVVVRGPVSDPPHRSGRIVAGIGTNHHHSQATSFAAEEAGLWDAGLELVQAWPRTVTDGQRRLDTLSLPGTHAAGLKVQRHAVQGNAAEALLTAAVGADLLVVGARRRHGLPGLELGSVNHAVLHHAPCPVAVLPAL